jgi:hypothetical protein
MERRNSVMECRNGVHESRNSVMERRNGVRECRSSVWEARAPDLLLRHAPDPPGDRTRYTILAALVSFC